MNFISSFKLNNVYIKAFIYIHGHNHSICHFLQVLNFGSICAEELERAKRKLPQRKQRKQ